jgi:flagellar assembly factor FliW
MPTLTIQGTEISYTDKDIVTFSEGFIGLPHLRRMVLVRQSIIEPFLWLVSLDDEGVAFVVAEARSFFPGYLPVLPADTSFRDTLAEGEQPVILAIVSITADWQRSTANLRAPLFISACNMNGAQTILTDNSYSVGEPLPLAMAA